MSPKRQSNTSKIYVCGCHLIHV